MLNLCAKSVCKGCQKGCWELLGFICYGGFSLLVFYALFFTELKKLLNGDLCIEDPDCDGDCTPKCSYDIFIFYTVLSSISTFVMFGIFIGYFTR